MLDRLGTIVASVLGLGFALVMVASWLGGQGMLGEGAALPWLLWLAGVALVGLSLPFVVVVGGALLARRLGRALGLLATPVEPAVLTPGWRGWRFSVEDAEHEVWIDDRGSSPRIVCDGNWAEVARSGRTMTFAVGRWPATITERVDWDATVAGLPLAFGTALLGDTGAQFPMRYDLSIGGTLVPDAGRLIVGRNGVPVSPGPR